MQTGMVPEEIAYLLGSETRVQVLAALEDGPKRQTTVAQNSGIGHSTVHRCVCGLQDRGWLREVEGAYALTTAGEAVLSAYRSFADTIECVSEYEPLLRCLEDVDVSVPVEALEGAEMVVATDRDPHAPVVAPAELLRTATVDRIRAAWSGVSPITNGAGEEYLAAGNEVEMVVDRRTLQAARSSYFDNYQLALASDNVDLHVTQTPIAFGLMVAGDHAAITGYTDGRATVCVYGSDPDLRAWVAEAYERVRTRADRLEVRYPSPAETETDPEREPDRRSPTQTTDVDPASSPD